MEINLGNTEIVIVAAQNNFRDEELFVPENMFSAAGAYVLIASNEDDEPMMGMVGGSARANIEIEDIDVDGLDALVIAGGTGSIEYLWDDEKLRNKVRKAYDKGKIIGAICLSGVVLARAGILEGKELPSALLQRQCTSSRGTRPSTLITV